MLHIFKTPLPATITVCFIIAILIVGYVPGTLGSHTHIAHAAETMQNKAQGRHIFLDPQEVKQPVAFSVKIEGSHFPANDAMTLATDAGYSSTPACQNNDVDGMPITTDPEGGFTVTGHFMGCVTNTVDITLNDDGHLYRTILDID